MGWSSKGVWKHCDCKYLLQHIKKKVWKRSSNDACSEAAGDCLAEGSAVLCFSWYTPFFWEFGPWFLGFLFPVLVIWRSRIFQSHPIPMKDFNESWKYFISSTLGNLSQRTFPSPQIYRSFVSLKSVLLDRYWNEVKNEGLFFRVSEACIILIVLT